MVQEGGYVMKLTKYEHACFTVENQGQLLVVDPGNFTTDFIAPDHVVAVVITHEHTDHFSHEQIEAIIDKNPTAVIIGHADITNKIQAFPVKEVAAGESYTIGAFDLQFFGGQHAGIHDSLAHIANLGVLINDLLYYPGDSLFVPDASVDTLALPVTAPWLKIGEVMDFVVAVHPRIAFPTHDAIASHIGKSLVDRLIGATASAHGVVYSRLSKPIEL